MSYQNYITAMKMATECDDYEVADGVGEDRIKASEEILGVSFSRQCREFYRTYNYMSFFGAELFGVDPNYDADCLEGNSLAYALNDREEYGLPNEWIPVCNLDDGYMAYLDYSVLNEENEPRVIMANYNGNEYELVEVLADDFGDFVLQLIEEE